VGDYIWQIYFSYIPEFMDRFCLPLVLEACRRLCLPFFPPEMSVFFPIFKGVSDFV